MSFPFRDIASVLLARQIISQTQLAEAQRVAAQTGAKVPDVLLQLGYVTPAELLTATAIAYGMPTIDLTDVTIPAAVIEMVPESVARENVVIPVAYENGALRLAIADPSDIDTLQKLQFILNRDLHPVLALKEQIVEAINRH
jgi:type IV pilus assembly protein PilB